MALVHSLWTAPMLNNERGQASIKQIETTIWCFASSVAYAKRLGENIHLYADDYGRELLGFLPYDKIDSLDIPADFPTDFWAAGKFFALKKMQLGDIHIDGDVFIKTPELMDVINNQMLTTDLIVQSLENSWSYDNEYYINCVNVIKYNGIALPNQLPYVAPAFNCGLVGFNNAELKEKYLQHYFKSVDIIKNHPTALEQIRRNKETWMDLLIEQQHLFSLSRGYKVCNLLGSGDETYINARTLGYQHLLGTDKWEQLHLVKKQLYKRDRELFYEVKRYINTTLHDTLRELHTESKGRILY